MYKREKNYKKKKKRKKIDIPIIDINNICLFDGCNNIVNININSNLCKKHFMDNNDYSPIQKCTTNNGTWINDIDDETYFLWFGYDKPVINYKSCMNCKTKIDDGKNICGTCYVKEKRYHEVFKLLLIKVKGLYNIFSYDNRYLYKKLYNMYKKDEIKIECINYLTFEHKIFRVT